MKKVFVTILSVLAVASMVCSCKKDNKNQGGKNNGGGEETTEVITIDGKFTDWDALKDVAVSEVPEVATERCNMLLMKGTADSDNIYLYFEYQLAEDEEGNLQKDAPFDIFFDADGNSSTGFISWIWSNEGCGWDYLCETEGGILKDGAIANLSDMNIYRADTYTDAAGVQIDGWDTGAVQTKLDLKDFAEAAGTVKNGIAMFEVSILRSVINANKKGSVGVGITISDAGWNTMGVLPLGESGVGEAEFMQIAIP